MIDLIYVLILLISFGVTVALTPYVMRFMRRHDIVGRDMNKPGMPIRPEMGGVAVVLGFFSGAFVFIYYQRAALNTAMMALLFGIMGCAFTGILDDLLNLRRYIKAVLPFFFALPVGLVMRWDTLDFSVVGLVITSAWIVPLLIPFGITCGANATNMLEGLNGLGTGLALIAASTLAVIGYLTGNIAGLWLLFPLIGALAAFLIYNIYPAKVFPGDTLTLSVGGIIASAAIASGLLVWGIVLFSPMILEFILKTRGRFKARNQGEIDKDGRLHQKSKRIESLTHLVMHIKPMKEWQIVGMFWLIEGIIGVMTISLMSVIV